MKGRDREEFRNLKDIIIEDIKRDLKTAAWLRSLILDVVVEALSSFKKRRGGDKVAE